LQSSKTTVGHAPRKGKKTPQKKKVPRDERVEALLLMGKDAKVDVNSSLGADREQKRRSTKAQKEGVS